MVFYYEQKEPIFHALLVFAKTTTIFGLVLKRPEFWILIGWHCTAMGMFKTGMWDSGELGELSATWEAVSTTQMFMVFLLTFYNGHCYDRYLRLYEHCMEALDGAIFFVQEVVVSLAPPSVENHRIRAVKYSIAMLHIFFVGLTGRMKSKSDWREIVNRGLLTKLEAEQLQKYPSQSIETILVVATWAMQIVDKALEDDAMWHERSMRIAHTHNRMQTYMTQVMAAMHEIGDELACPIPFPLYHLMNLVLIFNLVLLCTLTAVFETYQTVFPLLISILFFLGLREVAANLSDPFHGRGFGSDFPIAHFLQYAFDTSVCLMEAFRHGDPTEFVKTLIANTEDFTNEQLRHSMDNKILYRPNYDATCSSAFSWHKEFPLYDMTNDDRGPEALMRDRIMIPGSDDMPHVRHRHSAKYKEVEKVKPRSLFARLFSKQAQNAAEPEKPKGTDMIEAEVTLEKLHKRNEVVEEKIERWTEQVEKLKALLEHQRKVGAALNLPVEEIIEKAMEKNRNDEDVHKDRLPPEFTSFSELRSIVAHATAPA